MFAFITFEHPTLQDAPLRAILHSRYPTMTANRQASLVGASSALAQMGLSGDVWYAFRPTATSGAFCIRHAVDRMEVLVDPMTGGGLWTAAETAVRDLGKAFKEASRQRLLGKRVPFTGSRGRLDRTSSKPSPIVVLQSNCHPSGMSGEANSWLKELRSRTSLVNLVPAGVTVILMAFLAFAVGEAVGEGLANQLVVAAISPAALILYTVGSSFFSSRNRIKWKGP